MELGALLHINLYMNLYEYIQEYIFIYMNSGWHIYLTIYYIPGTVLIARNTVENKNNRQKNPCPRGANSLVGTSS